MRCDIATAIEEGMSLGGKGQVDRGAGGGSITDESVQLEIVIERFPGRPDKIDDVVLYPVIDIDGIDHAAGDVGGPV